MNLETRQPVDCIEFIKHCKINSSDNPCCSIIRAASPKGLPNSEERMRSYGNCDKSQITIKLRTGYAYAISCGYRFEPVDSQFRACFTRTANFHRKSSTDLCDNCVIFSRVLIRVSRGRVTGSVITGKPGSVCTQLRPVSLRNIDCGHC